MEIRWMGNENTNSSDRRGYVPFVIVDHISVGSMSSMDSWFTSPNNNVSSAHFGVSKDGRIHQYVRLERMAWAQGLTQDEIDNAKAQVVRDMGVNPNYYAVSIEHEGYNGSLTEEQFQASVWLHRYIREEIYKRWNRFFPLDRYHVIGHYQVNPVEKPFCPGPNFPWDRLYTVLKEGDDQMFEELRSQIDALRQQNESLTQRVQQLESLHNLTEIPTWAQEAVNAAVAAGLVDTPEGGSRDFYRILTVMERAGLLNQ